MVFWAETEGSYLVVIIVPFVVFVCEGNAAGVGSDTGESGDGATVRGSGTTAMRNVSCSYVAG